MKSTITALFLLALLTGCRNEKDFHVRVREVKGDRTLFLINAPKKIESYYLVEFTCDNWKSGSTINRYNGWDYTPVRFYNKDSAINFAKRFTNAKVVDIYSDSVMAVKKAEDMSNQQQKDREEQLKITEIY